MDTRASRTPHLGLLAATLAGLALWAPSSAMAADCDRVAAPSGSDSAAGTQAAPFATVQHLADALAPGQTGCLRRGDFTEAVKVVSPGITLTSFPGERARVIGRLWVTSVADGVTVTNLDLDGRTAPSLPSPLVLGDRATFRGNDVTNANGICFNLGAATWSPKVEVQGIVIDSNRIHNCGRLPATNHDHGIYVENARDTLIVGNAIYDNADRAINLYPDAQGTVIRGNVMDGNGEGVLFSGDFGLASSGTVVEGNTITNTKLRDAVESWYPDGNPKGTDNAVRRNCIFSSNGTVDASEGGFTATDNLEVNPLYVDRAAKDFRLSALSPCTSLLDAKPTTPVGAVLAGELPVVGGAAGAGTPTVLTGAGLLGSPSYAPDSAPPSKHARTHRPRPERRPSDLR